MMHQTAPLLPSGFSDLLPPFAKRERGLRNHFLDYFGQQNYQEVSPPLVEFEESLVSKHVNSEAVSRQTFRMMDIVSQKTLGLRADMTPQISRIAAHALASQPLPLRLCYAGTCLRVRGEGLAQARQSVHSGIELIGVEGSEALSEILRCATESLALIGLDEVIVDFNLPALSEKLAATIAPENSAELVEAIDQKSRSMIERLAKDSKHRDLILNLLETDSLEALETYTSSLPTSLKSSVQDWKSQIEKTVKALPQLRYSLDPLEFFDSSYYDGLAFSLFSPKLGLEIGRGGRYLAHNKLPAYGFTLYVSTLLKAMEPKS